MRILIAGGSGLVGRALSTRLASSGHHHVRVVARRAGCSAGQVDACAVDVANPSALAATLLGVDVACYLVHSLGAPRLLERETRLATGFAAAAARAGVRRIVYLGGLLPSEGSPSTHLRARAATGEALRSAGVPVIEFRAGVVLAPGSLVVEVLRQMLQLGPVLLLGPSCRLRCQPIGLEETVSFLEAGLLRDLTGSAIIDIGGPTILTWRDLILACARSAGLRRHAVTLPVNGPSWFWRWLGARAGLSGTVCGALFEDLEHDVVIRDPGAARAFAVQHRPLDQILAACFASARRSHPSS